MCQSRGLIVQVKTHHDRNLCTMRPSARCGQVHDAAKPSPGAKAWRGHSRRPRISGQAGDPQPVLTPLC
jgi:hypothetical protein